MQQERRDLLKKAAIGGAVVWTAPVVLSGVAAGGPLPPSGAPCGFATSVTGAAGCTEYTVTYSLTGGCGPGAVVSVLVRGTLTCPVTSGVPIAQGFAVANEPAVATVSDSCGGVVLDCQEFTVTVNCA